MKRVANLRTCEVKRDYKVKRVLNLQVCEVIRGSKVKIR